MRFDAALNSADRLSSTRYIMRSNLSELCEDLKERFWTARSEPPGARNGRM